MKKAIASCALLLVLVGGLAVAGNNPGVAVTVHVLPHAATRTCSNGLPAVSWCKDLKTTEASTDVDWFPVFYELSEYMGVDYSVIWPGTYTCSFTTCSDLCIGDIVDPGDGISQVWFSCRSGNMAVPGWGRIYEPHGGRICVVPHPVSGEISILDCNQELDSPAAVPSCAGIGGQQGDDPCGGDSPPIEEQTWGEIKSMFE